jgi:hypothetical protein
VTTEIIEGVAGAIVETIIVAFVTVLTGEIQTAATLVTLIDQEETVSTIEDVTHAAMITTAPFLTVISIGIIGFVIV